ncbi:MAG: oligosaccharide flippase family protein [Clostridia bacterium]|nr:oligosaccharide flippase family protein [Clostridia bacterium]
MAKQTGMLFKMWVLGLGTFFSKLAVLLMMPLYSAALTPAEFGRVDILVNTAVLLIPLCALYAPEAVFRFAAGGEREGDVLAVGGWLLRRGGVILAVVLPIIAFFSALRPYVLHIALYVLAAIFHSYYSHVLRARGEYGFYAVQQIFSTLVTVLMMFLFLTVWRLGVGGYLAAVYAADMVTAILLQVYLRPKSAKQTPTALRSAMLHYGLPLIPTALLWWLLSALDRYVLLWFHGSGAVGIYAAAYKLPALITLAASVFLEVWHYAVLHTEGSACENMFNRVYGMLLPILFGCTLGLILLVRPLIKLFLAADFGDTVRFVPLLAVAALFSALSTFLGSVYTVKLRSGGTLTSVMFGVAVHGALCFLLIPKYAILGAVFATLFSSVALFCCRAISCKKMLPFSLRIGKMMLGCGGLVTAAFASMVGNLPLALACVPSVFLPFWREIGEATRILHNKIRKMRIWGLKKEKRS